MLARMGAYVDRQERIVCGEWCSDAWPDCDSHVHDEGRAILALLGPAADPPGPVVTRLASDDQEAAPGP